MTVIPFDGLAYFEKLKAAGVPEEQAKIQAEALRNFSEAQSAAFNNVRTEKEIATKGDLRETELRLQKEIREVELKLQKEIEQTKYALLKWQIGGWIALAAIMAKGFGWLGF